MKPRAALAAALVLPAVVIATQLYVAYRVEGIPVPFMAALATQLCHWEVWAFAGPWVWKLEHRWPLSRRTVLKHAVAAFVVAILVLAAYLASYHALIRLPVTSEWFVRFNRTLKGSAVFFAVSFFHVELMIYCAIVAAAYASRTSALLRARDHETLRLEAELSGARLKTLRAQLQPHFLFNTLHTVGSLVLQGRNQQAVGLIAELGELLRGTLANRDTELAPLGEEVEHLRRYLRIEEARFGDRLAVEWHIDPSTLQHPVPPFILQPIVENAFRHGIARITGPARLRITSAMRDGELRVTVENDGPALPERFDLDTAAGYGLRNVQERLRARSPAGRLEIVDAPGGVSATLVMPSWEGAGQPAQV
jgi:two-component system, LytTR family, sensor kinase